MRLQDPLVKWAQEAKNCQQFAICFLILEHLSLAEHKSNTAAFEIDGNPQIRNLDKSQIQYYRGASLTKVNGLYFVTSHASINKLQTTATIMAGINGQVTLDLINSVQL